MSLSGSSVMKPENSPSGLSTLWATMVIVEANIEIGTSGATNIFATGATKETLPIEYEMYGTTAI